MSITVELGDSVACNAPRRFTAGALVFQTLKEILVRSFFGPTNGTSTTRRENRALMRAHQCGRRFHIRGRLRDIRRTMRGASFSLALFLARQAARGRQRTKFDGILRGRSPAITLQVWNSRLRYHIAAYYVKSREHLAPKSVQSSIVIIPHSDGRRSKPVLISSTVSPSKKWSLMVTR